MTRHGSSDDQAASLALSEVQTDSTGAVEGSGKVSLDNLLPLLDSGIEDTVVGGTASVGDEDIDLAEVLDHVLDQLLDVLVVANVALVALGLDTVLLAELLGVLLTTFPAGRVGDGNVSTHLSAATGGLSADTSGSGSAGNDNDLALQGQKLLDGVTLWNWDRHGVWSIRDIEEV